MFVIFQTCRSKLEELARREQKKQLLDSGAASTGLLRPSSVASTRRSTDGASDLVLTLDDEEDIEGQLERRERQAERERLKQSLCELGAVNPSAGRGRERLDRTLAEQTQRKLYVQIHIPLGL